MRKKYAIKHPSYNYYYFSTSKKELEDKYFEGYNPVFEIFIEKESKKFKGKLCVQSFKEGWNECMREVCNKLGIKNDNQ